MPGSRIDTLQVTIEKAPALSYSPTVYSGDHTLHWCLPGDTPAERTFTSNKRTSGKLHVVDLSYDTPPEREHTTRDQYTSVTAARASRRIKNGPANECPFCSDKETTAYKETQTYDETHQWAVDHLIDFQKTVVDSCRPERDHHSSDINFAEITTTIHGTPYLEILTNTSSLRCAYPQHGLPNWYSLAYAIAQHPWLCVKEHAKLETDHTQVLLEAKRPDPDEYGDYYYDILSQRESAPYETKTPTND